MQQVIEHPLRDMENPLEKWDEDQFIARFRLSKAATQQLLQLLLGDLDFCTQRNHPIPPHIRLLTALRFYATGNMQRTDGDLMDMHQSTSCRIVHCVSRAIAKRRSYFMKFPTDLAEIAEQKLKF